MADISLPTSKFDWVQEAEIDEAIQSQLVEKFPEVQDILDASIKDISDSIDGVGASKASSIKRFANRIESEVRNPKTPKKVKPSKKEKSEPSPTADSVINGDLLDHIPTKQELARLDKEAQEEPEREYVLVETPVDKFYRRRTRILLGPSICRECGFDVLKANRIEQSFDELNSIDKSQVLATLREHMKRYHSSPSGKRILTESEMRNTDWTSPEILKP